MLHRHVWIVLLATMGCGQVTSATGDPDASATPEVDAEPGVVPADAGPPGADAAPVATLSDDFEGTDLDPSWQLVNGDAIDIEVSDGHLTLVPTQYLLWFDESRGALVYKPVTGDFRVTAMVTIQRTDQDLHLAGLMARDPSSDEVDSTEDYAFIVLGRDATDQVIETKSTRDGDSAYEADPWDDYHAELRLCRTGDEIRLYYRLEPELPWTHARTYTRPDLPATLQVGANVYAASPSPDLNASYESIDFAAITTPTACTQ